MTGILLIRGLLSPRVRWGRLLMSPKHMIREGFFQLCLIFYWRRFRLVKEQSMVAYLRVGIGPPLAAKGLNYVDKAAVVLDPPLGAARLLLLLLLGVHLRRLAFHFAGTGERSVHL